MEKLEGLLSPRLFRKKEVLSEVPRQRGWHKAGEEGLQAAGPVLGCGPPGAAPATPALTEDVVSPGS